MLESDTNVSGVGLYICDSSFKSHAFTYITNTQSDDLTGKEPHDKIKSERRTETLQKVASHEHNAKNLL